MPVARRPSFVFDVTLQRAPVNRSCCSPLHTLLFHSREEKTNHKKPHDCPTSGAWARAPSETKLRKTVKKNKIKERAMLSNHVEGEVCLRKGKSRRWTTTPPRWGFCTKAVILQRQMPRAPKMQESTGAALKWRRRAHLFSWVTERRQDRV